MTDVHVEFRDGITRIVFLSPTGRSVMQKLHPGHQLLYGTTLIVERSVAGDYLRELEAGGLKIKVIH